VFCLASEALVFASGICWVSLSISRNSVQMIYATSDRNVILFSSQACRLIIFIQVHLVGLRSVSRIFYACGKLLNCVHLPAPKGKIC